MHRKLLDKARHSGGQVLVWVAVLLVVLLAFAGLAIDGGIGLSQRREMQNAADAGALAGARELCLGNRAQAKAQAQAYAQDNGAGQVKVEIRNATGTIDEAAGTVVWVEAQQTIQPSLLGVIGVQQYTVNATAKAGCMQTPTACGLWPIAFPQSMWEDTPCGTTVYIWDDDKISYDCEEWDCVADDGSGARVLSPGERGWLDFKGAFDAGYPGTCPNGGGANLIKALIEDDCAGRISLPACIPGEPGVKASVDKHVDARAGDNVTMPLFDYVGCNGNDYHIASFGCFEVVQYNKKATIKVWDPKKKKWITEKNTKVIEVIKTCDNCLAECGTVGNEPASGGGDLIAIGLIE